MKQNILLSALLAAMLVIAGCGGGNNGFTQEELDDAVQKAVTEAKEGTVTEEDAKQRETTAKNEGLEEGKKQGRMEANTERMATALYAAIKTGPADLASSVSTVFEGVAAANKASETAAGKEGAQFKDFVTSTDGLGNKASAGSLTGYYPVFETDTGSYIKGDDFGTSGEKKDHKSNDVDGTYNGVKGTYRCNDSTACRSSTDGDGNIKLSSGWHFKPDSETDRIMTEDLAEWGWWIGKTGDLVQSVNLYYSATGLTPTTGGNLNPSTGKATYTGTALGKYAFNDDGADHGHFTADTKLTADFNTKAVGGPIDRDGQGVTLSGEITNFKVGDDKSDRKWKVVLQGTESASSLVTGGKTLWHIDDTGPTHDTTKGNWQATMYGVAQGANNPDIVLGGFSAVHNDARMIGSFGATPE